MNNELFFDSEDYTYSNSRCLPSGRKTLNQIFDVGAKLPKGQESLHYAPIKSDATKNESPADHQVSWSTRLAKIVIGFKNGETVGRVGVAILRNIENAYRIIVYKTKTNLLATYTIQDNTNVTHIHRQNCYWQFYDDNGFYWSLLFERSPDEEDFINKLKESGIRVQLDVDRNSDSLRRVENHKKSEIQSEKSKKPALSRSEDEEEELEMEMQNHTFINNRSDRAQLLVRIPKMGGQQLPTLTDTNAIGIVEQNHEIIDTTSVTIVGQTTYPRSEFHTQYVLPMAQSTSVAAASSSTVFSPAEAQMMQMMLVENRTQNAELRINIDKLEVKIEKVMDKINMLQVGGEHNDDFFKLEEKILALKKENRRLKRETKNVNGKNESTYENVYSIYGVDLANLGIDIDPSSNFDVDAIIGELIDKVSSLQTQLQEKENQLKNVSNALKDQKERNHHDKKSYLKLTDELEQAHRKIEMLQSSLEKKKETETQLNARINDLKVQHSMHLSNVKMEMTETLKDIMNTLYHNLAQSIVSMEKLLPDKILALIGKTIRQDTLSAVAKIGK